MEWTDEGTVLGVRRHGEANAMLELMARRHGRHLPLPVFLAEAETAEPPEDDLADGFALTGFFLARHVLEPRGLAPGLEFPKE
jgi:recombinational DNA repair protein (RecF pathway)